MEVQMFKQLVLLVSFLGLAACSAKVEGIPDAPPAPKQKPGPNVQGKWSTGCVYDANFAEYRLRELTFKGSSVVRKDNLYTDSTCVTLAKQEEAHGKFSWGDKTSYGGYQIDYRFDLGNGWWQMTHEELLLENDVMYISDFYSGWGSISKDFPMVKQ